jgi:hypothetical protein
MAHACRVRPCVIAEALDGTSLVPVLRGEASSRLAFSQYPRCLNTSKALEPPYLGTRDPCIGVPATQFTHMCVHRHVARLEHAILRRAA